jgi:DNA repair protein RadA/Sms
MNITGVPGGVSQIRMNGYLLTQAAKSTGVPVIIVGQITKEGVVAGPKLLEHVVDTVLYLQGDEFNVFRVLRSIKNRYGATSEIGVFEMIGSGLREVGDPSEIFIESHKSAIGTAISATLKGSRVVFTEIQALTADVSSEGVPVRRVANGIKRVDWICYALS